MAGPGPPAVARGKAAEGDQAVEVLAEDRGETVDDSVAAAAVVDVVAGYDEEEALAVGVGTAQRVDTADHVADLPLYGCKRHRRIVVIRVQTLQHPSADVD